MKGFRKLGEPLFAQGLTARLRLGNRMTAGGDSTAPTVVITSAATNPTYTSPIAITITFSEQVQNFVVGDITVGNGAAGNFATADNIVFTANITPTADGTVTVDVASGVCTDVAGNPNTAATQFSIVYSTVFGASLTAFWKLDEVSDGSAPVTRNATVSALHLTDNGTTPSAVGKIGNAINCTPANSECLSRNSEAGLQIGDVDWTMAIWCQPASIAASIVLLAKYSTSLSREYQLQYDQPSGRFIFNLYDGSNAIASVTANTFGAITAGQWYFIVIQHDSVNNKAYIGVNNVFDNANTTGPGGASAAPFSIGARGVSSFFWNGLIDDTYYWKGTMLNSTQLTFLYNGGSGRTYPF